MKRLALAILLFFAAAVPACAANCFWVGGTGTWNGVNTASWSSSTGGTASTCGGTGGIPGAGDNATFDASSGGGIVTVNTTVNLASLTMGAFTGTLDFSVNNNNVTLTGTTGFSGQGNGVRTLKMGNGTWTLTNGAGNIWRLDNITNLTFNANGSTIAISNNGIGSPNFLSSTLTYSTIQVSGGIDFATSSITIGTLNLNGPSYIQWGSLTTFTVSTALSVTATSSNPVAMLTTTVGSQATMVLPASSTMQWVSLRDMNFTGSGSTPVASNAFNLGNNTAVTITGPSAGGGGGACIIGGWLLWRDMPYGINDNFPAWLNKAA